MGRYKYRFGYGFANGIDSFEQKALEMFEKMSEQGYLLKKRFPFAWKFVSSEPGEYSFSADYSWFVRASEFETYKEIFASAGWEYVCSYDYKQIA